MVVAYMSGFTALGRNELSQHMAFAIMFDIVYQLNAFSRWNVDDLGKFLLYPASIGQFSIFYSSSAGCCVGFCTWAFVTEDVLAQLQSGQYDLQPDDWQSGTNLYIADFVCKAGLALKLGRVLRDMVLKNHFGRASAVKRSEAGDIIRPSFWTKKVAETKPSQRKLH